MSTQSQDNVFQDGVNGEQKQTKSRRKSSNSGAPINNGARQSTSGAEIAKHRVATCSFQVGGLLTLHETKAGGHFKVHQTV